MQDMSLEDFKTLQLKRCSKDKHFKVRNSFGVYDAYKLIRKNKWFNIGRPLKEKEFYAVVRGVNNLLADNLANGETVTLPEKMGVLELRKWEAGVRLVEGKLKITYPVDWKETWKLWYKDAEARQNNILLRNEQKQVYSIRYNKYRATYENKVFYEFTLNRFIKKALKQNIQKGKTDTLW